MKSSLQSGGWFYANMANFVTITRLLLAFWLVLLAIFDPGEIRLMCALVVVCALSDLLDGYLARKLGIISKIGEFLDRLSDKVFICSLIIFIAWAHPLGDDTHQWLKTLTQSIVGVVILFECILMASGFWGACRGFSMPSNKSGKIKMTMESIAVVFWFVSLVVDQYSQVGMLWPLVITNIIFIVSIFYALKSVQGYYEKFSSQHWKKQQ